MTSDKELDDLLMGVPEKEKPKQKFCVKVISKDELGHLKSKLLCISIDVPDKQQVTRRE